MRSVTLLLVWVTVGCGGRPPLADAGAAVDAAVGSRWVVLSARLPVTRHTATLVPDGTVLLVGGVDPRGDQREGTSATWRFDPAGGELRSGEPMAYGRANHAAVLLADGRVLVLGGALDNRPASARPPGLSAEIFDPTAHEGSQWAALPRPGDDGIGVAMAFRLPSRPSQVFHLSSSSGLVDVGAGSAATWRSLGPVEAGLFASGIVADDGSSILTFGGNAGWSETEGRKILRIDTTSGEVRPAGLLLSSARDSAAVVRHGADSYWVIGGWEAPGQPSTADSVERVDLGSGLRSLSTLDDAAYHDVRALPRATGDVLLLGASAEGQGITVGLLDAGAGYRRIARIPYDAEWLTATLLLDGSVLLVGDLRPSEGGPPGAVLRFYP